MILGELVTRIKRQFGDESGAQITKADIIRWANDAQRDLAVNNNLLQRKATTPAVSGQNAYAIPTDALQIRSVKWDGNTLQSMTQAQADQLITNNDNTSEYPDGTPQYYWVWAGSLYLWPAPDIADTNAIEMFYIRQPTQIAEVDGTSDATAFDLPVNYHNAIRDYCLAQAYELDDNWTAADRKKAHFTNASEDLKNASITDEFYPFITDAWGS